MQTSFASMIFYHFAIMIYDILNDLHNFKHECDKKNKSISRMVVILPFMILINLNKMCLYYYIIWFKVEL